jgi:hypothetical protein
MNRRKKPEPGPPVSARVWVIEVPVKPEEVLERYKALALADAQRAAEFRRKTVKAQKERSTKSAAGRKLVYERLDQLFSESPDWLNKKPDAIAKHIHGDILKKVREMPEKERPLLEGRSTVRKYVKEHPRVKALRKRA